MTKVYRGTIVHCLNLETLEVLHNALIGIDRDGKIVFVEKESSTELSILKEKFGFNDWDIHQLTSSQFLMPGFVDTHIHAPQYRFTGTGYDKKLRDWLNTYTFPTEMKFADVGVAREVYPQVVKRTLNNGTTTASYYATIHLESTKELCKIIAKYGQRALVGIANVDSMSLPGYIESAKESIDSTLSFIQFVEEMKNPLVQAVITPRCLTSCSKELLTQLAQIAREKSLPIQSHLCEQLEEIDVTLGCHPNHKNCTEIFDKMELLTEKTYMAHCIHLKEEELKLLKERNVGIAHCPNSNFSLKSGFMDARDRLSRGMKIGLGTDVSGGFSPSILDAIRYAMQASNAVYIRAEENGKSYKQLTLNEAIYMATLGGAQVLNLEEQIGNFQVGKQFDALLIDVKAGSDQLPVFDIFADDTFEDILSKFIYLGNDGNIIKVFVAGNEVVSKTFFK